MGMGFQLSKDKNKLITRATIDRYKLLDFIAIWCHFSNIWGLYYQQRLLKPAWKLRNNIQRCPISAVVYSNRRWNKGKDDQLPPSHKKKTMITLLIHIIIFINICWQKGPNDVRIVWSNNGFFLILSRMWQEMASGDETQLS